MVSPYPLYYPAVSPDQTILSQRHIPSTAHYHTYYTTPLADLTLRVIHSTPLLGSVWVVIILKPFYFLTLNHHHGQTPIFVIRSPDQTSALGPAFCVSGVAQWLSSASVKVPYICVSTVQPASRMKPSVRLRLRLRLPLSHTRLGTSPARAPVHALPRLQRVSPAKGKSRAPRNCMYSYSYSSHR